MEISWSENYLMVLNTDLSVRVISLCFQAQHDVNLQPLVTPLKTSKLNLKQETKIYSQGIKARQCLMQIKLFITNTKRERYSYVLHPLAILILLNTV